MAASTSAPGEKNLATLLSTLKPALLPTTYVFATLPFEQTPPVSLLSSISTIMIFREQEGLTLITSHATAEEHGLKFEFPCRMLTLQVHSSLEAVGFMAVISKVLGERGIGCNPVSGFYHDHCFVPTEKAEEALEELRKLALDGVQGWSAQN